MNNQIEHDQQERLRALNARQSFIVQAPAGSGKTELLIQRFLTLLKFVKTPEEILAITFTKKAANEMRARILKALIYAEHNGPPVTAHALHTWQLAKQVLARDKELNWHIIINPNRLRIQTIDSFCAFLTNQLPLLSQFGAPPEIAENADWLYELSVQEILMHVEKDYPWSKSLANLLLHLDNDLNNLHDLFVHLLNKRDQWLPHIQFNADDGTIRSELEMQLQLVISDHLCKLKQIFPTTISLELLEILRYAAHNLSSTATANYIPACKDLISLPGTKASDKIFWQGIAELLLTKSGEWRKRLDVNIGFPAKNFFKNPDEKNRNEFNKTKLLQFITQLSAQDDLKNTLMQINLLPDARYENSQWEILQDLIHVLKIVSAQLRITFQQYGKIDYIENARAAILALGDEEQPTDLALALDYKIQHILLDEFQDTSYTQYQLLEKLTYGWEENDGRTLFIVGDPMQSIYRFREAEVGLFIRLRNSGLSQIRLNPITLSVNFRSAAPIIEWNNTHFSHIFPAFNDIGTGAVTYSESHSPQTAADNSANILEKGFTESDLGKQANFILEVIQQLTQQNPSEKIAILVRSRTHLSDIIPVLKNAAIPYHAIDIDALASRQHIQDLLALTCALLHPSDRIAWLSCLRAPWCGLTLQDLLVLAGNNSHASMIESLENLTLLSQLTPDGQTRVQRFYSIIKAKLADRDRWDLRVWIESTWILLGGPACLNNISDNNDVISYFKLLEKFSFEDQYLQIHLLKEKITQLYAATQNENANVHIMTIHTAKGLEFDTVILPHLEKRMPSDDKTLLSWSERPLANNKMALLLAPINATGDSNDLIYSYIRNEQKTKLAYETDRLFYVATTRAKKNLYLCFDLHRNEQNEIKLESGSFLEKLWPFVKNNYSNIETENTNIQVPTQQTQTNLRRLISAWQNPFREISLPISGIHQTQSGFKLINHSAKIIGTVTHHLLHKISVWGIAWWENQSFAAQADYLEHQLRQLGVLTVDYAEMCQKIQTIIGNTLKDPKGKWILQLHHEAKSEFSITAKMNDKIESLIIDRTFIDEKGTRWIIDYKTATFSSNDLDLFLRTEKEKYLAQMQKYATAIKLLENRPLRLGLYFPAIPSWVEYEVL